MKVVSGDTREETWFNAIKLLLNDSENFTEYNMIMEIKQPLSRTSSSIAIGKAFDKLLIDAGKFPLNTVADTIFPAFEYKKHGVRGVFDVYPEEIYPSIKCVRSNSRGTYAFRMVRGIDPKGKECNPLKNVLEKLKSQISLSKGKKSVFELSLDEVSTIPIYRNDSSLMGFPCLSHLSFKLSPDKTSLHLTAIYRSHYYIEKALGNLLGLARLQSFLARELGINSGTLVCHSTLATLEYEGISKTKIKAFVNTIEKTIHEC